MGDEIVWFLCGLSCVVVAVTVIGHAIWVGLAAVFKMLGGGGDRAVARTCPRCGATGGLVAGRCIVCGAVPNIPPGVSTLREELQTTARQINRLLARGVISQEQNGSLQTAIQAELSQ